MAEDKDLVALVLKEKDSLKALTKSVQDKDKVSFVAKAANLLASVASKVPVLGGFAEEGVRTIWAKSAYAKFEAHLAELEAEEQEDAKAMKIAQFTAGLMNEGLSAFADQLREEMASKSQIEALDKKLDGFAESFKKGLVEANIKLLSGHAVGARFGTNAPKSDVKVNVDHAKDDTAVLDFTNS